MKKGVKIRKLSRPSGQRKALLKGLVRALFLRGKIKTTEARAKEMNKAAQKFITKAKDNSVVSKRYFSRYFDKMTIEKLVNGLGVKYRERRGGYTRIIKIDPRKSDGAKMAVIELI